MTDVARSPALARVDRGNLCAGCGACSAIAPGAVAMARSCDGFLRPVQTGPVDARAEAGIAAICPGLGLGVDDGNRSSDPLWGPYLSMHEGYAADPDLRREASSGGALSALLVDLLESGAVDRVLQTAADPELPIGNRTVLSADDRDVFDSAGSRYAPSAPLAGLDEVLGSHLRYAFVGKPCDVAALRAMARSDARVGARFPYMLSFFCAGVPSLDGAREVLARMGVSEDDLARFRYRGGGWPGHATATRHDGSSERMSYSDSWGGVLSRHVQLRCKICPDGTGSLADVVCADAWETDAAGYPLFTEREGVSLVIARTETGSKLLSSAVAAGRLVISEFDMSRLSAMQPGQTRKRRLSLARLIALRMLFRPTPRYRGFHLLANAARAGLRENARNLLGTLWRGLRGRL